jgi:uncharacterized membrane protein
MQTSTIDTTGGGRSVPGPDETTTFVRHPARSSRGRSLAKTLSWRVVATFTTFLIAWIVTGNVAAGVAIGGVEAAAKMVLYYGHERAWETVG